MPSSGYVVLHSRVLVNTLKKNKTAEAKRRFLEYSMNSQLDITQPVPAHMEKANEELRMCRATVQSQLLPLSTEGV